MLLITRTEQQSIQPRLLHPRLFIHIRTLTYIQGITKLLTPASEITDPLISLIGFGYLCRYPGNTLQYQLRLIYFPMQRLTLSFKLISQYLDSAE